MPPRKKQKTTHLQDRVAAENSPEPHVPRRRSTREFRQPKRLGFETTVPTSTVAPKPRRKPATKSSKQVLQKKASPGEAGLLPKQKAKTKPREAPDITQPATDQTRKTQTNTRRETTPDVSKDPKNKAIHSWLAQSTVGGETSGNLDHSHHPPTIRSTSAAPDYLEMNTTSAPNSSVPVTQPSAEDSSRKSCPKWYDIVRYTDKKRYNEGLCARDVRSVCETDHSKQDYLEMIRTYSFPCGKVFSEKKWEGDLKRSRKSNEATFQRTAMMDIFDREALYDEDVPRRPSQGLPKPFFLAQPKPDIVFSFNYSSIVDQDDESALIKVMDYIRPESQRAGDEATAFPFCFLEVKRSEDAEGSHRGQIQNLNTASSALRNIWEVMSFAGYHDEFAKVRVFSIVANPDTVDFRLHRAETNRHPKQVQAGYPLVYRFDELTSIPNNGRDPRLTVKAVQQVTQAILIQYGVKTLSAILRKAVKAYANKQWQEDSKDGGSAGNQPHSQKSDTSMDSNKRAAGPNGSQNKSVSASKRSRRSKEPKNGMDPAQTDMDVDPRPRD
ncbi:MAG: hypothetical protein M1831_004205 [Alyxoria varia]|nr:MAG: hypothetical protein M1831_004205 [Alyxoria varia]